MATEISLWDSFSEDHWLRAYGRTQVIVIDDIWHNESEFILTTAERKKLEKSLNIKFHFFSPPESDKWNDEWFSAELEKAGRECPNPAIVLLDLMFGKKEKTPLEGSGKRFLKILSRDERFREIPVLIITAGEENEELLHSLKAEGGPLEAFLNKNSITVESLKLTLLEWALLSDPHINAFSLKMREAAQKLRKVVLDDTLKESIQYDEYEIPRSVLLVGESGSGKNYLSNYLHRISDRKDHVPQYLNFTDMSSSSVEVALFGAGPSSNSPARYHLNPQTGEKGGGTPNLAIIGAVTNARGSTLILDELGNSPAEIQTKLIRFLDDRQILPVFWSEYVPSGGYYDVWVITTMQPQHREKLKDLERRLAKMTQIDVPPLSERKEDIIPLSVFALDNGMAKRPKQLFTPNAIEWLKANGPDFTVSILTNTIISNLKLISSKAPYNADELLEAKGKVGLKNDMGSETVTPATQTEIAFTADSAREHRSPIYTQGKLNDYYLGMTNYVLWALEKGKDERNSRPSYPKTWFLMTGQNEKNSTVCQRNIGNIIFQVSDEDLVSLIKKSETFKDAVFTCGKKIQSVKKRLLAIRKLIGT